MSKSAIGGLASGLAGGLQVGDEMMGRQEDRDLRARAEDRAQRLSAIQEEKGQLDIAKEKEDQAYVLDRRQHLISFMKTQATTEEDGTPIAPWKLEMQRGQAAAAYDLQRGKISAKDQLHFAEFAKKADEEETIDAFNKLYTRDKKGAAPFLKKFGLSDDVEISPDGMRITGTTTKGDKINYPISLFGAPFAAKAKAIADIGKSDAETKLATARANYWDAATGQVGEEKDKKATIEDLNKAFGPEANGIERQRLQLDKHEEGIDKNPNLSDEQKTAQKAEVDRRRSELEQRHVKLQRDAADSVSIVRGAKEAGVKNFGGVSAARGILQEAARGTDNIIIKEDGTAYYRMPGVKGKQQLIPLPSGSVPQSVFDKRRGPAAAAPAPAPTATAPAQPGRVVRPLAEREAEIARMNALAGGGRRALTP